MDNPNIDNAESVKNPSPFITFTARTIPATFDTSMSYQEALFALVNYLQSQVTPAINENAQITNEQTAAINTLYDYVNHYFDNLDVQEEINNKLDDMAESGELAEIIAQYANLGCVFGYHTIADMASASNLKSGSIVKVLGKTDDDTGDGSFYKIRTRTNADVPDGVNIVVIQDTENLVAQIIPDYGLNQEISNRENADTTLSNRITEVDEKEFFNIKVTPNFYYDSSRTSHQGSCAIGNTLFVYSPSTGSDIGVIEKFNLSTRTFIDAVSNIKMYHGGSMCAIDNLIYSASYDNEGIAGNNKICVYNPVNDSVTELSPFAASNYNTIWAVAKYDDTHLICLISEGTDWKSTPVIALLDLTDYSYTTTTLSNPSNMLIVPNLIQGVEYYNGYLYILADEPKTILKIRYDGTSAVLKKMYSLPNIDELGIPLGEIEDITHYPAFGDGTMLITNQGSANGGILYCFAINVDTNLPSSFVTTSETMQTYIGANTIYVNNSATGLFENGTSSYPFKKLTRAIQYLENSTNYYNKGRIQIVGGDNYELSIMQNLKTPLTILNRANKVINITSQLYCVCTPYVSIAGTETYNFNFTSSSNAYFDTSTVRLYQCTFNSNIQIENESDILLRDCKIKGNGSIQNAGCSFLRVGGTLPVSGTGTLTTAGFATTITSSTSMNDYNYTTTGNATLIKVGTHNAD